MNATEKLFDELKSKQQHITDLELNTIYDSALQMARKFKACGQVNALCKLVFIMDTIELEHKVLSLGVNTFIYKDDIDFYIDSFSSEERPIKIIELSKYDREIPDEISEVIAKTKDLFTELYVLYTDYSDTSGKRVEAEKRSTDPILFGVFMNQQDRVCVDRFYVLGDWIDPYCDLTLERFVSEMALKNRSPRKEIFEPLNLDELREYLSNTKPSNDGNTIFITPDALELKEKIRPYKWFDRIKSWLK